MEIQTGVSKFSFSLMSVAAVAAALNSHVTNASTEIRFDTSGFPLLANDRPSTASTISIHPELEAEGKYFVGRLDLQLISFLGESESLSFEGRDLYVATTSQLSDKHQISVGRRFYDWSRFDQAWNLGIYTPRFTWDPVHPQPVGMNGVFYRYEHRRWSATVLGSPISVPERGAPIIERGGSLVSANPFWATPLQSMPVFDQNVPIQYRMVYPEISELILHPTASVSLAHTVPEDETGPEARLSYANLPIHQPATAMVTRLNPTTGVIEASLHPFVLRHELVTAELGFRQNMGTFTSSVWASGTREWAKDRELPANWIARDVGNSWIGSVGGEITSQSGITLGASYMAILENREDIAEASLLPPRYPYERAFKMDLRWRPIPKLFADARWIHDLKHIESQYTFDLTYRLSQGWMFGVGADFFATSTGSGWIGQFEGDDRIRGRISYAF